MTLHPAPAPDSLLRLARAGDQTALGKLLESYRSYLLLLVRLQISRKLQSKLDADDFVQETFLEAHRTFAGFRGKTEKELMSWLRSILASQLAQLSLGRRIALKVLPFAAAVDAKRLQRFKNEAQAAAQLHHNHIVPVYAVGCARGVHYYAMQFIEGEPLSNLPGISPALGLRANCIALLVPPLNGPTHTV
jgi:serine/threonine protein kinase